MASRGSKEPQHDFRFVDVDEEPQKTLPLIEDYENTPLVSLNEAIIPLESIVPDIKNMMQTIKATDDEPEDGLTRDESNSIRLYSLEQQPTKNSLFYILNKALRSDDRKLLRPWFLFLRLIITALSRLPSTPLIVYRGSNLDLTTKYPTGATVTWWGFSSCLKKNNLLEKRLFLDKTGRRTLFVINCFSGRDIHRHSSYEGEDEVLLLPARQFNVVNSVDKGKGLHIIELSEIQPADDFLNLFLSPMDVSIDCPTHKIEFQSISTVSLSKKWLPAALPNHNLEEIFAYVKQRSSVNLSDKNLFNSDMDTIISEIIIKRQCKELNLYDNHFTYNGVLKLSHTLQKNKVSEIGSYGVFSS